MMTETLGVASADIVGSLLFQSTLLLLGGLVAAHIFYRNIAVRFSVLVLCLAVSVLAPVGAWICRAQGWVCLPYRLEIIDIHAVGIMAAPSLWNVVISACSPWVAWLMLASVLVAGTHLVVSLIRGIGLVDRASEVVDRALVADVVRLVRRVGIQESIAVRRSDEIRCPVIWCWSASPSLILPAGYLRVPEGVLCHELCHVARRDHVWSLLVELMSCLLAWHPLTWVVRRRICDALEQACDARAAAILGSRSDYASALVDMVPSLASPAVLAVASSRSALSQRIVLLLSDRSICGPLSRLTLSSLLLLGITIVAAMAAFQRPIHVFHRLVGTGSGEPSLSAAWTEADREGLDSKSSKVANGDLTWVGDPARSHEDRPGASPFLGAEPSLRFFADPEAVETHSVSPRPR